jgi:hypothetical protein
MYIQKRSRLLTFLKWVKEDVELLFSPESSLVGQASWTFLPGIHTESPKTNRNVDRYSYHDLDSVTQTSVKESLPRASQWKVPLLQHLSDSFGALDDRGVGAKLKSQGDPVLVHVKSSVLTLDCQAEDIPSPDDTGLFLANQLVGARLVFGSIVGVHPVNALNSQNMGFDNWEAIILLNYLKIIILNHLQPPSCVLLPVSPLPAKILWKCHNGGSPKKSRFLTRTDGQLLQLDHPPPALGSALLSWMIFLIKTLLNLFHILSTTQQFVTYHDIQFTSSSSKQSRLVSRVEMINSLQSWMTKQLIGVS